MSCVSRKASTDDMITAEHDKPFPLKEEPIGSEILGPRAIIYKTIRDFSNNVPIVMDATKTKIVYYPAPSDVYYQGRLAKPLALKNGYWLDNRGIGINTVFTDFTYEEYSSLQNVPGLEQLYSRILEKNPMVEIIDCGIRPDISSVKEDDYWNKVVDNDFSDCKRVLFQPLISE